MSQRDLLPSLIQIAEINLPQLKHEIDANGSSIFKLQAAVAELHTIITYIVHHTIDERRRQLLSAAPVGSTQAPTPAPAPVPRAAPAPAYVQRQPLPALSAAAPIAPQLPVGLPGGPGPSVQSQGPVMDVTITPQGTRVTAPGAAAPMILPPGAFVDTTILNEKQIPDGVILQPGGEMSPEVAAALGAARNVTSDPIPG